MQIFVLNLQGSTINLKVKASDTVDSVMDKLTTYDEKFLCFHDVLEADAKLWSSGRFYLKFNDVKLECGRTLSDYNIQKESVLRIKFAGLGGKGKNKKEDKKKELEDKLRFKKERMGEKCSKAGQQVSFKGLSENTVNELIHEAEVFLQASDGDASQAIETMLKKLPSATLDKMKNALKQDTGGDSAFKLKQTCGLFFGDKSEKTWEVADKLDAVREGVESLYDLVLTKAFKKNWVRLFLCKKLGSFISWKIKENV